MPGDPVVMVEESAAVLARWPDPREALTAAERGRAAALRTREGVEDFVAAHLLAREAVARLLAGLPKTDLLAAPTNDALAGLPARVVLEQRCEECGGPHGRPYVVGRPEVSVSWSHSHGHVAAAASYRPVGIDLESTSARRELTTRLLARTATPAEAAEIGTDREAFLRMWVIKEALVKVGVISLDAFATTDVRAGSWGGFRLAARAHGDLVVGTAQAQAPTPGTAQGVRRR